jgi:hypothetical protein
MERTIRLPHQIAPRVAPIVPGSDAAGVNRKTQLVFMPTSLRAAQIKRRTVKWQNLKNGAKPKYPRTI